jgi:hypothetical protein
MHALRAFLKVYKIKPMSDIEELAFDLLSKDELQLAAHLSTLDNVQNAGPLMAEILPIYWTRVNNVLENHQPGNIYRPLYYIHKKSLEGDFMRDTRSCMDVISSHIEGCLQNLLKLPTQSRTMSGAFGPAVAQLKSQNMLSPGLANSLWRFNEVINVRAKHFGTYAPTSRLDERTFGEMETVYAVVIMRSLSIPLFALMKANGVLLPEEWPQFKIGWL